MLFVDTQTKRDSAITICVLCLEPPASALQASICSNILLFEILDSTISGDAPSWGFTVGVLVDRPEAAGPLIPCCSSFVLVPFRDEDRRLVAH